MFFTAVTVKNFFQGAARVSVSELAGGCSYRKIA